MELVYYFEAKRSAFRYNMLRYNGAVITAEVTAYN